MIGFEQWDLTKRQRAEAYDRLGRISEFVKYAYPEHAPFDYQARYYDDHVTRWIWVEAARQVGKSVMSAHKGLVKAVTIPNYRHIWCSYTLDDCREKIEYAEDLYGRMVEFREFRNLPGKIVERKLELKFTTGSRLMSVFVPRGKARADVTLDEFAHVRNPRKIYRAALPILIHGGQCLVMSTPTHSRTMFARMGKREGGKFRKYVRARLFWYDCPIHCNDVSAARREAPAMDPESRVRRFGTTPLQDAFDNMFLEDFLREFELTEADDDVAFLPWSLILQTAPSGEGEEGTPLEVEQYQSVSELKAKTKGRPMFAGFDVGRRKDKSELTVFVTEGGRAVERYCLTLDRTPFPEQKAALRELMSLRRVMMLRIDETGLGMDLAETLKDEYGHRVEAVTFGNANKRAMASNMRALMEQGKVLFRANMNDNFQMHSVKKSITKAGMFSLIVDTGDQDSDSDDHHADRFWSRALALYGMTDRESLGQARVGWV
jgi:phage FluMu gp28-like protein